MEDKIISVKLNGDSLEKVQALAKENSLTVSAQIRLIIKDYFKNKEN